jgi:ADP-heptose:LPS heptosyltransferase
VNKNFKIFSGRASLIGDTIMFLPVLNYLELKYPNSYKIFPISQKTSQSAPLFINHQLIDKIYILGEYEGVSQKDIDLIKSCDIVINPFPQHPDVHDWWNYYNCVEETFRMAGFNINEFKSMPEQFKKPKLEKWFQTEKYPKTIAIWPFAGYNQNPKRNPSKEWWKKTLKEIEDNFNFQIFHFGATSEPNLGENLNNYHNMTHLSFFEMIKITLGCDVMIGTDSGSSWVIGAYGFPQINLIIKNAPNHIQNLEAFAPENYLNNKIDLFGLEGTDSIMPNEIVTNLKNFYAK